MCYGCEFCIITSLLSSGQPHNMHCIWHALVVLLTLHVCTCMWTNITLCSQNIQSLQLLLCMWIKFQRSLLGLMNDKQTERVAWQPCCTSTLNTSILTIKCTTVLPLLLQYPNSQWLLHYLVTDSLIITTLSHYWSTLLLHHLTTDYTPTTSPLLYMYLINALPHYCTTSILHYLTTVLHVPH